MKNLSRYSYLIIMLVSLIYGSVASASVVVSSTRVIYPAKEKEVTVKLTNQGKSPVLVQSWIDNGDINSKPDAINVPFILTPPINRVDEEKSQTLRLSYTGTSLPQDRESVFWLNVLEIPQSTRSVNISNRLQVAFRTRIKVFYRPSGLMGTADDAAKKLAWNVQGNNIIAKNSSPYYVSLLSVSVGNSDIEGDLVPPFGEKIFVLKHPVVAGTLLKYDYINDWGAVRTGETK